MPISSVFVSSAQRGFEDYRDAARDGVQRAGYHPIMAETTGAASVGPRRALLDEVGRADVFLLILGTRYGEPGESGMSPTEDEYDEAVRLGKQVVLLVQDAELEAAQAAFLGRVRGGWDRGLLYEKFSSPHDLALSVTGALADLRIGAAEDVEATGARATELARGEHRGFYSGGVTARLALVPSPSSHLLGPLELEEASLVRDLATAARSVDLISHRVGIADTVTSAGVILRGTEPEDGASVCVQVGADGAVIAQGSVQGASNAFSGSLVDPERFSEFLSRAGAFARVAWDRVDARGEVRRVAAVACVPEAESKVWGRVTGSSMRMSIRMGEAIAPQPPGTYPRGEVSGERFVREIAAAMRRVFADADALA